LRLLGGSSPTGIISIFMLRRSKMGRAITQAVLKIFSRARALCGERAKQFTFAAKIV